MKKLLLYVGLFALPGFIEAAAGLRTIVWDIGVSGTVVHPDLIIAFGKERAEGRFSPITSKGNDTTSLIVEFHPFAKSDDKGKLAVLKPSPGKRVRQLAINLPAIYSSWNALPLDAQIVLRYSNATKVSATIELALNVEER